MTTSQLLAGKTAQKNDRSRPKGVNYNEEHKKIERL